MNAIQGTKEPASSPFRIAADALSKRYNREWIFRNLTYEFQAGTYAITGPNGSGKSTLLQVLWGQVPPTSGTLQYRRGASTLPVDEVYQHVAIATPYMDLIDEFTLAEMVRFHFSLKPIRPGVTPEELPTLIRLEDARDKQLINFSSGMRQRLKLALAFYTQADVYFLDEPGTNLDSKAFDWYRSQLPTLPAHAIVIIASNNPDEYPSDARGLHMPDLKRSPSAAQ